jgi:glucuronate isomerase
MSNILRQRLQAAVDQVPTVDIHSHIDFQCPAASDINDIVFYHYIVSELAAAGMSPAHLSPKMPPRDRLRAALPYLPRIANTSTYWALQIILRDLYHVDGPLTGQTWMALCDRVEAEATDPRRVATVLERHACIRRTFLTFQWDATWEELDTRFFAPTVRMEPLVSRPWDDVLLQALEHRTQHIVHSAADITTAIQRLASSWRDQGVVAVAASFEQEQPREWAAIPPSRVDAALRALHRGEGLSDEEADDLNVFTLRSLLAACDALRIPMQIMLGIRGLSGGLRLPVTRPDVLAALASLFADFPNMRFDVALANPAQAHELASYAKMHPNVWVAGYWWYALYPSVIRRMLRERIEMLPGNKINGFFSDAYCVEWSYAKVRLVRRQIAHVLGDMVEEGYLEEEQAITLAADLLDRNPGCLYLREGAALV